MTNNVFGADKSELLESVLDRYNARYRRSHVGWQSIHCINTDGHIRGDKNPSASINLAVGYYKCFTCDLAGDGYDLMLELENIKAAEVLEALELEPGTAEKEFLF